MPAVIGSLLYSGKLLLSRSCHLPALIVSITAHLLVALGIGKGYGIAPQHQATLPAMSARLINSPANIPAPAEDVSGIALFDAGNIFSDTGGITQSDIQPDSVDSQHQEAVPAAVGVNQEILEGGTPAAQVPLEETPLIIPLVPPASPHYFTSKELTAKPRVVQDIPAGLTLRLPGEVPDQAIVRLLINEQGWIDSVLVEDSKLSAANEKLIKDAFQKLIFSPGKSAMSQSKARCESKSCWKNLDRNQNCLPPSTNSISSIIGLV